MLRLTLAFSIAAFLLFRPFQMQEPGMLYPGDDRSYFAFASSMAYGQYPSFDREWFDETLIPPLSRVGPGLMAMPFVAAFSVVDRIAGSPIVEKRTAANVPGSWSLFGAVVASWIYLWLSCLFLYKALEIFVQPRIASLSVILLVFCQGLALYAFRRPLFSHVNELFAQSALFYLFVRPKKPGVLVVAALTALVLLARQNGMIYAALWPILIFGRKRWKEIAASLALAFAAFYAIKYFPWFFNKAKYEEANKLFENASFMFKFESPYFYFKRLYTVLFGADWGLIYTAPFLLLGAAALARLKMPRKRELVIAALPLLVNLYILIIWKGQGGWYGYRYLLFSAVPVLALPFALLLARLREKHRPLFYAVIALAIVPSVSMLLFEATPKTNIEGVVTEFGERNGGNLTYQIEAWKVVATRPAYFLQSVFKAGPVYVVYALAELAHVGHRLPAKFHELFRFFDPTLVVKTLLLYLTPWVLYWTTATRSARRRRA